jgi:flagellar hook-basal body protein
MGLFGSLFTGVSALFAQSQSTAIISNNIANVNTTGFKRSEAAFNSLVTTESRLARYSPGTVSVNRIQRVDAQGSIQQTSSGTDGSIAGNGFFPVKRSNDASQPFLYTRAGQFSEDAQGLLRNASGFVLYAWPIDTDGNLPANQGDLTSLVQADVAFLGGLTRPTTSAEVGDQPQRQPGKNDLYRPRRRPLARTAGCQRRRRRALHTRPDGVRLSRRRANPDAGIPPRLPADGCVDFQHLGHS